MPKAIRSLDDIQPDPNNVNAHTARGMSLLETSIRETGVGEAVTVDQNGVLIGGEARTEVLQDLQMTDAIVVPIDGTRPVILQRTDLDMLSDDPEKRKKAQRLALMLNRVGELNFRVDPGKLADLIDLDLPVSDLWTDEELMSLGGPLGMEAEAFAPNLAPETTAPSVSESDLAKARKEIEEKLRRERAERPVTCPHCGEDFYLEVVAK